MHIDIHVFLLLKKICCEVIKMTDMLQSMFDMMNQVSDAAEQYFNEVLCSYVLAGETHEDA